MEHSVAVRLSPRGLLRRQACNFEKPRWGSTRFARMTFGLTCLKVSCANILCTLCTLILYIRLVHKVHKIFCHFFSDPAHKHITLLTNQLTLVHLRSLF